MLLDERDRFICLWQLRGVCHKIQLIVSVIERICISPEVDAFQIILGNGSMRRLFAFQ